MNREKYTIDQLINNGLAFFDGDNLAAKVWQEKYALKSGTDYIESKPSETLDRLIGELFRIESKYANSASLETLHDKIDNFRDVIFGGSILFGVGNNEQVSSLGNCFFVDNGADSYGGIFNIDEVLGQLMKRRGGVGITIENLRPTKAKVNNSAQSSTGAPSFMHRYSSTTREIAQDGRRGALMISCHVAHPNIMDFIMMKDDLTAVTGANVSVKVTDDFMMAVEAGKDYMLHWPVQDHPVEVNASIPYNKMVMIGDMYLKRVKAKDIWDAIMKQAHKNAEPGVLFWDNIIRESPADCYSKFGFKTKGTNPCGEVPLSPFDSCRLASSVLLAMVDDPFTPKARINYDRLEKTVRFLQRMMDDIIDLEEEKILAILDKIESDPEPARLKRVEKETWETVLEVLRNGRRTGLGVLGLGDMLAALGIRYGSKEATTLIDEIFRVIAVSSYKESVQLAKERGCFPLWNAETEKNNPFIVRVLEHFSEEELQDYFTYGRRNIATLSIAPTGTLALMRQVTSGIEPVFKISAKRRRKVNPNDSNAKVDFVDENGDSWEEYYTFHEQFLHWFKASEEKLAVNARDLHVRDVATYLGSLDEQVLDGIISRSPWAGSESHSVDYLEKVNMQGVIQKWVDHAISVTHNLPEKITVPEVNDIYFMSWKAKCKGCTIYREGSRSGVILSNKKSAPAEEDFTEHHAPKRPKELAADYYVLTSHGIRYAVIVGLYKEKPYEIFAFANPPIGENHKGKIIKVKKGEYKFTSEKGEIKSLELASDHLTERAHTILLSMLLRHGTPVKHIIDVAAKIDDNITSFSSACKRVLSKYVVAEVQTEKCPECGHDLVREEGCIHCTNCSYSKC